jgi:hypothetical protein
MPSDECLRLHFHFCLRMYVSSPPPGVQTYRMCDIESLQDDAGMYENDENLPALDDPIWNSPLGREVLRAAMARCAYLFMAEYTFQSNNSIQVTQQRQQ